MRLLRCLGFVTTAVLLAGCYTLQPAGSTAPSPGEIVALDINDAGRVALGGSMGPEIARIEGTLVGNAGDEYVLSVRRLQLLRGGEQSWSGERVRISRDHVGSVYEREFSRARSVTFAAVVVGGVVAFFATRDLLGLGRGPDDRGGPKPPPETLIWR
ncbi:MAG: hypothetical protein ACREOK_12020 [Gemmatimonadaceae bacterium]